VSADLTVIAGKFGKQAPSDLAQRLRELADAADRGELVDMVACYTQSEGIDFLFATSMMNSIALATMLQQRAVQRMGV
jgi:hypothetical protein